MPTEGRISTHAMIMIGEQAWYVSRKRRAGVPEVYIATDLTVGDVKPNQ